eukprot:2872438-Pleurochrysis_carterae.AAC.1
MRGRCVRARAPEREQGLQREREHRLVAPERRVAVPVECAGLLLRQECVERGAERRGGVGQRCQQLR